GSCKSNNWFEISLWNASGRFHVLINFPNGLVVCQNIISVAITDIGESDVVEFIFGVVREFEDFDSVYHHFFIQDFVFGKRVLISTWGYHLAGVVSGIF